MQKFTIPCELTDLNTYSNAERTNRYIASKIKKEETYLVATLARAKLKPIEGAYKTRFLWITKDERKDADNVAFAKKFIHDGLVVAGITKNDSRKFLKGFSDEFAVDKSNPRVEVEIHEII